MSKLLANREFIKCNFGYLFNGGILKLDMGASTLESSPGRCAEYPSPKIQG